MVEPTVNNLAANL